MNVSLKSFFRSLLPTLVKGRRIIGGPLRGARIVTSWYDYPAAILGRTERPLLNWFAANVRLNDTWLDIGAHYGYTAIALCRLVGQGGRVFAFEPMISTAGYVSKTRLLNNFPQLIVLPLGLANPETIEMLRLPVVRGMVDSLLLKDKGERTINIGPRGRGKNWQETTLTVQLDWFWSYICGGREKVDGVKIDVQGMEIEVLRGMSRLLSKWKPKLVVEMHKGVDRSELLDVIKAIGYSPNGSPVEPVIGEAEAQYLDDRSYIFLTV